MELLVSFFVGLVILVVGIIVFGTIGIAIRVWILWDEYEYMAKISNPWGRPTFKGDILPDTIHRIKKDPFGIIFPCVLVGIGFSLCLFMGGIMTAWIGHAALVHTGYF